MPSSIGSLVMQPESIGVSDNAHNATESRRKPEAFRLTTRARNCPRIIPPPNTSNALVTNAYVTTAISDEP